MAPTLTHEKSGRSVVVPEGTETVYLDNGWKVAGSSVTPAVSRKRRTGKKAAPEKAAETEAPDAGTDADEGGTVSTSADVGADDPS